MIYKIVSTGVVSLMTSLSMNNAYAQAADQSTRFLYVANQEARAVAQVNQDHGITKDAALANYSAAEKTLFAEQPALENAIVTSYAHQIDAWQAEMNKIDALPAYSDSMAGSANIAVPSTLGTSVTQAQYGALQSNIKRLIKVLPELKFNELFPVRRDVYSYRGFLKAASKYPTFCAEKNDADVDVQDESLDDVCRMELASMFAHFAQEVGAHVTYPTGITTPNIAVSNHAISGADNQGTLNTKNVPNKHKFPVEEWKQGLYWVEEISHAGAQTSGYQLCEGWQGKAFPCGTNVSYHGRGAKQLSWNYNYGPFSQAMYGDNRLLDNPALVAQRGELAFGSAFWFYMTPRSPKPSIHETVTGFWQPSSRDETGKRMKGFGVQTMIINGGLECGGSTDKPTAANREKYFKGLAGELLGESTDKPSLDLDGWYSDNSTEKHDCRNMRAFENDASSPYYYKGYYTKGWDGSGNCILVAWEASGFSPFKPGDLAVCNASADGVSRPGTGTQPPAPDVAPTPPPTAPTPPPTAPEVAPPPANEGSTDNGQGVEDGGIWNSITIYWGGTIVELNGVKWKAKWWTQGDVPGSAMVWEKYSGTYEPPKDQPDGDNATGAPTQPPATPSEPPTITNGQPWVENAVYTEGNTVTHKGETYEAKWWTAGVEPGLDDPVWRQITNNNPSAADLNWNVKKVYFGGDVVNFNGVEYRAKWWTRGDKPGSSAVWAKV